MRFESVTAAATVLEGQLVRLEPMTQQHAQGLYNRGRNFEDWRFMPRPCFVDLADVRQWIDEALAATNEVPFVIVETGKNKPIGSTRFLNIRAQHRSLEIGWTWLGQDWQRTGANTEAKWLLLSHAFDQLGCIRVEFKTDARNLRSQRALERIGATREGVLRSHMIVQNEVVRDSVYFSVIRSEWPAVNERLTLLGERG